MIKGSKHKKEVIEKISISRKGKGGVKGDKNYNWKGDKVGYWGIHKWINRLLGQPKHCAICNTKKSNKYEWANISGSYKREISDWIRLCSKCHINFDKGYIKIN